SSLSLSATSQNWLAKAWDSDWSPAGPAGVPVVRPAGEIARQVTSARALVERNRQRDMGRPRGSGQTSRKLPGRTAPIQPGSGPGAAVVECRVSAEGTVMQLPDFLVEWPYGEIMLQGHRIGLYTVIRLHKEGLTPEQIEVELPPLSQQKILQVLDFYR